MKWTRNKGVLSSLAIILLLVVGMGVGYIWMDGENPIQMGVTMWYLNDTARDGIKIAADPDRHLVKLTPEQIADYLPKFSADLKGEWELKAANGSVLLFEDTKSDKHRTIEVDVKPFLNQYFIIRVLSNK